MKSLREYRSGKNKQRGQRDFQVRLLVSFIFIIVLCAVLISRFAFLQVNKHQEYVQRATSNRVSIIPTPPIRGEITDINGVVLARNYPAYSLEIIPSKINGKFDDLVKQLEQYVSISADDLKRYKRFRDNSRDYENIPLKLKLTVDEASALAPQLYQFPGVEINARTFREYPYGKLTAHVLGYIGRISIKDVEKLTEADRQDLYRGTTHIGKLGLEAYYEPQLHGIPGMQEVEKDAAGNIIRVLNNTPAQSGQTLRLAMDIRMQQKADELLGNRRGAVVAIDPQTGGVLALVSKPSFDPNLFIDGIDSENWKALNENWETPMINRTIQGLYPPGSTFKPFISMAILESGKLTQTSVVPAPGAWSIPGSSHQYRDSVRSGHGAVNLQRAITVSSDTFFYRIGYEMGIDKVAPYLKQFDLGQLTGIDLPNENKGILPSREWKKERFKKSPKNQEWHPSEMVSISIGQGYNTYTPLQMAHATAILSNNGVVYRPHVVKELHNHQTQQITLVDPKPERTLPYKQSNFDYVKKGMEGVLRPGGTGWRVGSGLQYTMGGKTGTAQVKSIAQGKSYNAAALAVQHRDHAWFISFAPVDKPKIAIAVILENGGWGATAAPVARQLTDFYLLKILGQGSSNELSTPQGMTVLADETLISESSKTSLASLQAAFAAARQAPQAASGVKP